MRRIRVLAVAAIVGASLIAVPAGSAGAGHGTEPASQNMHALGHSPQPGTFSVPMGSG